MKKKYTFCLMIVLSLILFSACSHTAKICSYTPVYKQHIVEVTGDDKAITLSDSLYYIDENIAFEIITKKSHLIINVKNIKGDLIYVLSDEVTSTGTFPGISNTRSPLIPKGEWCTVDVKDFFIEANKNFTNCLKDRREFANSIEYRAALEEFARKLDYVKNSQPDNIEKYLTFVVHFYKGDYHYYTIKFEYEGQSYDYELYEKKYKIAY